jgi:uncharacterized protein YlxP (DUF503 family)
MSAYVAIVTIDLHFPDAGSLKGKRKELASVKALLHGRHGMAVAEVEHQDGWQRATLAGALVSGSLVRLGEACDGVERFLDARFPQGVRFQSNVVSFADLEALG